MPASFTCPICGMTSRHPTDAAERYCGNCHRFFEKGSAVSDRDNSLAGGEVVIRILGIISGEPTSFDRQWLVEYDPSRPGRDAEGHLLSAHVVTTPDRAQALRLPDFGTAYALWQQRAGHSLRPDGQPDRPLTAFTISIERADLDEDDSAEEPSLPLSNLLHGVTDE